MRNFGLKPVAFGGCGLAKDHEFGKVSGENFSLGPQFRHDATQHDGGADRSQNIIGRDEQGRRRAPTHPLQTGENFCDDVAAAFQRPADGRFPGERRLKLALGFGGPAFSGLHARGRLQHGGGEANAIRADDLQFRLDLRALRFGQADAFLKRPQFALTAIDDLVAGVDHDVLRPSGTRGRNQAERNHQRGAQGDGCHWFSRLPVLKVHCWPTFDSLRA